MTEPKPKVSTWEVVLEVLDMRSATKLADALEEITSMNIEVREVKK